MFKIDLQSKGTNFQKAGPTAAPSIQPYSVRVPL